MALDGDGNLACATSTGGITGNQYYDTIGCVALDANGNLACATSTGCITGNQYQ